jgi:hypothetical protein
METSEVQSSIQSADSVLFMKGSPIHPRRGNCRGIASVKTIVAFPVILMFTWLSIEIGLALRAYNHAKIASDAISLAAAARFRDGFSASVDDAMAAAANNRAPSGAVQIAIGDGPDGGGDVEFGRWDDLTRSFVTDSGGGPAVRVTVRFAADHPNGAPGLVLPGLFNPNIFAIERSSVAVYTPPKHITSLLVAGSAAPTLSLSGAASLVARGGISVSCDGDFAVSALGTASIEASVVRIEGAIDAGSESAIEGAIERSLAVADDPFAAVAMPSIDTAGAAEIQHDDLGTTLVSPGVHTGLSASGGVVVLQPGLHQFAGPISLSGNAALQLDGATIQLADGFGIEVLGQASITGTPSSALGEWSGRWAIQRSPATWTVEGSGSIALDADLYAPGTALVVRGTAQVAMLAAVLGSIGVEDQATMLFDGSVDELETAVVPGRARLVR